MKKLPLEPNILVTLIRITAHYKNEHEKKLRVYYKDQSEIHFTDLHLVHSLAHNKVGGYYFLMKTRWVVIIHLKEDSWLRISMYSTGFLDC